jgi:hypothetical protein
VEELEGKKLQQPLKKARISDTANKGFKEINLGLRSNSFDKLFVELFSSEASEVKEAIEGIFKKLADIYKEHEKLLDKTESAYHGFVYGFLAMNITEK